MGRSERKSRTKAGAKGPHRVVRQRARQQATTAARHPNTAGGLPL